jgi:hypothetical protein
MSSVLAKSEDAPCQKLKYSNYVKTWRQFELACSDTVQFK